MKSGVISAAALAQFNLCLIPNQALLDRTEARGQSAGSKDDIRLLLGSILVRRLNRPRDAGRVLAEINESKLDAANQALLTALKAETGNPS